MACEECRYHDKEQENGKWEYHKQMGVQAYERINEEKREGMRAPLPTEQTLDTGLKQENDANPAMGLSIS